MAASYPSGFDAMGDPGANLSTNPHSTMHNQINDVAEAIEAELGLSPSGASATVAARFTADEALISKSYTVCTSGTRPSSPTEGDKIFETDTNKILVYSGAAWSTIGPVHGALLAWPSPGIAQGVGVTFSTTVATYSRVGRRIFFEAMLVMTSTGTAANLITLSLPVTAAASNTNVIVGGAAYIFDNSATLAYSGIPVIATTTTMKFLIPLALTGSALGYQGTSGFTAALATNDILTVQGNYEAAADA